MRISSTLAEEIETAENHDVERTLFDVVDHERWAKNLVEWLCVGR